LIANRTGIRLPIGPYTKESAAAQDDGDGEALKQLIEFAGRNSVPIEYK